jgi:hypothetical protein
MGRLSIRSKLLHAAHVAIHQQPSSTPTFAWGFSLAGIPATNYGHRYLQMETLMKNGSKRRAWTTAHVRELKSLARKKVPAAKIARSLKRSEGATRQKAFALGISLDSRF